MLEQSILAIYNRLLGLNMVIFKILFVRLCGPMSRMIERIASNLGMLVTLIQPLRQSYKVIPKCNLIPKRGQGLKCNTSYSA